MLVAGDDGADIRSCGTGGSGIDMVGCHRGVIQSNVFRHTDFVGSTGVQAKGGTSLTSPFTATFTTQ